MPRSHRFIIFIVVQNQFENPTMKLAQTFLFLQLRLTTVNYTLPVFNLPPLFTTLPAALYTSF
jgi:hypothetical protein